MNVFRMMLFLAGVAVCLWVKYASDPGHWSLDRTGSEVSSSGFDSSLTPLLVYDQLEYGGKVVAVNEAQAEPVYEVSTAAGEVLARNLSSNDLQIQFPEIYAFMQTGRVASVDGPSALGRPYSGTLLPERESR